MYGSVGKSVLKYGKEVYERQGSARENCNKVYLSGNE